MDYLDINKKSWDQRTATHVKSEFYNVAGFLDGETSLREIELAEMVEVAGKALLHLQCHFGMDTLSWARKGAVVTGVDLSPVAIEQANRLKEKAGLDARFICSDVYEFGEQAADQYDIVFTSYGALCWLPDLDRWAQAVARCLRPGGRFYIVEFHPAYDLYAGYSYFHQEQADIEESGTYTENCDGTETKTATWAHTLGDVVNALLTVGITIDHLNEFPFSPYNCFEGMEERTPGRYYIHQGEQDVPLIYSILGTKTALKPSWVTKSV